MGPPFGVAPFEKEVFFMPEDQQPHVEQGQIERAKRLRDHIDRLKRGQPEPADPKKGKSLKEQIAERADEREK